jgi:hypothetical protein
VQCRGNESLPLAEYFKTRAGRAEHVQRAYRERHYTLPLLGTQFVGGPNQPRDPRRRDKGPYPATS